MRPTSPCKDCENRKIGCHSKCAEYMKFFHDIERFRNHVNEQKYVDSGIYEIISKHKKNKYQR